MKSYWILKGIKFTLLFALFAVAATYVVMSLWNWLMPAIFGVSIITFWQALGIFILAKILFGFGRGGWGHGGHYGRHYYWKGKMQERLKHMSPEERERFRDEWKKRCGGWKYEHWEHQKEEEPKTEL
ncbi:MAG: hypothetical protein JST18_10275 [Bacteroidetes bacterium]|nr:hypothetical protein [Bacteroidota bacterium]